MVETRQQLFLKLYQDEVNNMFDEAHEGNNYLKVDGIIKGTDNLDDKFDIEIVLIAIRDMNKKIDFLKELKKRRVSAIEQQVDSLQNNIEILQDAILNCMSSNNEKTLEFPDIGKVSVRKSRGSWNIVDDNGLYEFLKKNGLSDDVIENTWKFKKKELNKILDELAINNNIPDSVTKTDNTSSLAISFAKTQEVAIDTNNLGQLSKQDFDKMVI